MKEREDTLAKEYTWEEGRFGEDPEAAFIRKETRREALESMTDKQRKAFVLYYKYGYTQEEISKLSGVNHRAVGFRIEGALKKVKKIIS